MTPMIGNVEEKNGRISHVRQKESERKEETEKQALVATPSSNVIQDVLEFFDRLRWVWQFL